MCAMRGCFFCHWDAPLRTGYSRQQSREILEEALVAATAPELVVEMKWQPGDFVMWYAPQLLFTFLISADGLENSFRALLQECFSTSSTA